MMNTLLRYLLIALLALIPGCSSSGKFFDATAPEDLDLNIPAEKLVKNGMEEYSRGKYFVAL